MTHRPQIKPHAPSVFAGAWPHIKSLASLLCWTLDGRRLGCNSRRALMTLAYVLQKLSHVETFVLVRFAGGMDWFIIKLSVLPNLPRLIVRLSHATGDPYDGREPQGAPSRARRLGRPERDQATGKSLPMYAQCKSRSPTPVGRSSLQSR